MARKPSIKTRSSRNTFHIDFLNSAQKEAYNCFCDNDVTFLLGPAGVGKSYLATAFAINEILSKRKKRIILTRPIVEAGESLGFLPGTFDEKVNPYMLPLFDAITKLTGSESQKEAIQKAVEIAPLAYMRGRSFDDSVCIFDEAQNSTKMQLKLFLSRFNDNSKIIVTGDPRQSDLPGEVALVNVVSRLENIDGIGVIEFGRDSIVRHPLVSAILERLE